MLCNQKRKIYADRLQQLNRLGLALPLEFGAVDNQTPEVEVEQVGPDIDSPIVDLRDGRTLYVVWLSLAAKRPGLRLYDYRFVPPWPDNDFQQLPSFADSHIGDYYRLPDGLEYPREEVLNLNVLKAGWRLPSTRVVGVLCALSDTPIPPEFKHGASIPLEVKFFGRSGRQIATAGVGLCADRWREPAVTRPTTRPPIGVDIAEPCVATRPRGSSLYEGPPPALTVCERSRAEYLRSRWPCGFRITWGEKESTLSDHPSPSWQGLPICDFKQAEPSREEN